MINFKIVDGDIVFDANNNISLIDEDEELVQCIYEILKTNAGEWFLNDEHGFARFNVLGQKLDEAQVSNELSAAIFQESRIDRIEDLIVNFDRKIRKISVKFKLVKATGETIAGEVEI